MANNRMWLRCSKCTNDKFWIGKYYPSTGWAVRNDPIETIGQRMDDWFTTHKHGSMWGTEIGLELEVEPEENSDGPHA